MSPAPAPEPALDRSSANAARRDECLSAYEALLRAYLGEPSETQLQPAYEFGRSALRAGLGVLDMARLHHQALVRVLGAAPAADPLATAGAAAAFFAESLVPFEMTHRGFREAYTALGASEERYRELFENANDIVFTTDLDGNLTSVNRAGEQITGYPREEVSAIDVESLVAPEYRELVRRMRRLKLSGENTRTTYELEILARDGRRIPLEISTRLIYQNGEPVEIHGIARNITDRKQAERALHELNERLEEEARRIAHALHDEAGQLLASVYLALAELAAELPPPARDRLRDIEPLLDRVAEQMRRLAHELRPPILDDLGLIPALEFLADGVARRTHQRVTVGGSTGGRLAPALETALYRVAQEALTNVTKHARARSVHIEIQRDADMVRGRIADDGVGFDVAAVWGRKEGQGLGLIGMRERLTAFAGTLSISSRPGDGTMLGFEIPLTAHATARTDR